MRGLLSKKKVSIQRIEKNANTSIIFVPQSSTPIHLTPLFSYILLNNSITMTKSVSKVLTTSTVVAVAATAINQVEALFHVYGHNRLRTLQEEGEDVSASQSMPTNVESISNLMEEEKPKFQEKKEKMDIGILVGSVMSKNSELADKVSHARWIKWEIGISKN